MKEHPIINGYEIAGRMPLFKPEMRQANRDGKKTQTRRVITRRNSLLNGGTWPTRMADEDFDWKNAWVDKGPSPAGNPGPYLKLPYLPDGTIHRVYPVIAVGDIRVMCEPLKKVNMGSIDGAIYADDEKLVVTPNLGYLLWHWKKDYLTSIHMPYEAARSLFRITNIRVQRVQDISEGDAIAEGVDAVSMADVPRQDTWSRRQDFAQLWDSINAKRGYGWDVNPWVWVVSFKMVA